MIVAEEELARYSLFSYCKNHPVDHADYLGYASISAHQKRPYVELCVDTPNINSSVCIKLTGPIWKLDYDHGHVFLKLYPDKNYSGLSRYRNDCSFGFYTPSTRKALTLIYCPGRIRSEYRRTYDVKMTYFITMNQYKAIYNYCTPSKTPAYHLTDFNCATFALQALEKAGVIAKVFRFIMEGIKKLKIGEIVSAIGFVLGFSPSADKELSNIAKLTLKLASKASNKSGSYYSVYLLCGSHKNQYKIEERYLSRLQQREVIEFRKNNNHNVLKNLLTSIGVKMTKRTVAWRYSY